MVTNTKSKWHRDIMAKDVQMNGRATFKFHDPESNNIVLNAGTEEMLKITADGFYVRGVKVPQDDNEAAAVYKCFQEWLTWGQLNRQ